MKAGDTMKVISIFLIILFVSGCSPNIKNLDSKGASIICFGDSITYGEGAGVGEDYPSLLSILLKRDVINAGASGDSTDDALKRLSRDVLEKDPYIVIVELGGNDFLRHIPKERTLTNLREIISRIQEKNAIAALCDLSSGFILSGYERDYRRLAKETGAIFISGLLEGILNNPSLRADEIHPNREGYKIIAQRVYEAIRHYIE